MSNITSLLTSNQTNYRIYERQFSDLEQCINNETDSLIALLNERREKLLKDLDDRKNGCAKEKAEKDEGLNNLWKDVQNLNNNIKDLLKNVPRIPNVVINHGKRKQVEEKSTSEASNPTIPVLSITKSNQAPGTNVVDDQDISTKSNSKERRGGSEIYELYKFGPDLKRALQGVPDHQNIRNEWSIGKWFTRLSINTDEKLLLKGLLNSYGKVEILTHLPVDRQIFVKGRKLII